jgi:hypothetical protein
MKVGSEEVCTHIASLVRGPDFGWVFLASFWHRALALGRGFPFQYVKDHCLQEK